ncbi:MAG: endo-1,4-beta-xylanase [Lachnospiraceae bacterium]|nr:endo-1,4-beta-xylanase [Lachnospiraceae bacterium]
MKKKAVLLITSLLMASLVGCSSGNSQPASAPSVSIVTESNSSESTPASSEESTPAPEETATPEPTPDPAETTTLKEVFEAHGMKVGTCLTTNMIDREITRKIILNQFTSVTCENSMKPDSSLSQKQSQESGNLTAFFNRDAQKMMAWAKENGISMRGHTMVWYSQTPEWIFHKDFDSSKDLVDREEMLKRMESMIKTSFEQLEELGYIDIFYAYDVVNEAWMENGSMRQNRWSEIIGDDYLWYAFYYANKYAPESIDLYYNDYNEQFKTETLLKFVDTLKDKDGNYLIDGVGFQAHLYTTDSLDQYFQTMDAIAETGLKIQLTELDVCLGRYQSPGKATDENLQKQAQFYYDLIGGIFERVDSGKVKSDALTFWGFADSLSWRKEYSPLLYTSSFKAKPALYGALQISEYFE